MLIDLYESKHERLSQKTGLTEFHYVLSSSDAVFVIPLTDSGTFSKALFI